ncbi:hypothetical protein IFR04_002091 [Cadophora malorum]|uniref:Fido domain-containing protein n=1 Tax=Cadophora malorum TaxID=108018 RepID=A0A8H7WHD1_9HELO|nr:hypothetical protein IFR04_002091 [Cadophora malorum]
MPFMESTNSLFGKTTETKAKSFIPRAEISSKPDILDTTPVYIQGTSTPSKPNAPFIPAKSTNRPKEKFISGKMISLPSPQKLSTKSTLQNPRYSTGSRESTGSRMRGELTLRKRFSNGSTSSTSSGGRVGQRGGYGNGVRTGKGESESERPLFFLKGNPMLESDSRGKRKMRMVMDERDYTSFPNSSSLPSPCDSPERGHEPPKDIDPGIQRKKESKAKTSATTGEEVEMDLINLSITSPGTIFELLTSFHTDIREQNRQAPFSFSQITAIEEMLSYASTMALLSSNHISNAGVGGFEVMRRVHDEVMFSPSSSLMLGENRSQTFKFTDLVKAEREVVQHALAWKYLVQKFVVEREELSEGMIKETHEILMSGTTLPSPSSSRVPDLLYPGNREENGEKEEEKPGRENYAGVYRTVKITGFLCLLPSQVPGKMEKLVKDFNKCVKEAEERGVMDPVALAAEFHYRFVNFRPFLDGNGRVARFILNAVLLRWVGIVVPFGVEEWEREGEKAGYIGIVGRTTSAGRQCEDKSEDEEDGEDGDQGDEKPWAELATFILCKCVAVVEGVWDVLSDEEIVGVVPGWEELLIEGYLEAAEDEELNEEVTVLDYYLNGVDRQLSNKAMQD